MASQKSHLGVPPWVITSVLVIFVLGWLASLGAEIFKAGYNAPTGLNETMIAIVTAFFVAQQRLGGNKPDNNDQSNNSPTPPQSRDA